MNKTGNWCQHWFDFLPNPPLYIMNMIENLLAHHDRTLLEHFIRYRVTSQVNKPVLILIFLLTSIITIEFLIDICLVTVRSHFL
jgi:hypothetical protein